MSVSEMRHNTVSQASDVKGWLKHVPEALVMADIETVFVYGGISSEISTTVWQKLAEAVTSRHADYDGFIILTSADAIFSTASALAFALGRFGKPIIVTGSHIPEEEISNKEIRRRLSVFLKEDKFFNLKSMLIHAIQIATMDIGEVSILHGNMLMRGTRAAVELFKAYELTGDDIFLLGRVDFSFRLHPERIKRSEHSSTAPKFIFEDRVAFSQIAPSGDLSFAAHLQPSLKGLFLICHFTGRLSGFLSGRGAPFAKLSIPVVLYNQNGLMEEDKEYPHITVIGKGMHESLFVKFMWVLGQTTDFKKVSVMMQTEYAGEFGGGYLSQKA